MKKNYVSLLVAFLFITFSVNAQFFDDFESYPLGTYHGGHWSSWSGVTGAEDIIVSNAYAFDGTQSGLIGGSVVQDAMLVLNNATSGEYRVSLQVYIPAGKSGYMNFQGTTNANGSAGGVVNAGIFNSPNLIFNNVQSASGAPGQGGAYPNVDDAVATYTWQYPESTWFPIVIDFDVNNAIWTMSINGTSLPAQPFDAEAVLGGIDFYSYDANNEMYIDAIDFSDLLSVDEESLSLFSAYPNPVKDYLYLSTRTSVDLIEVYDTLGHKVLSTTPALVSPKIDLSNLASGAYFVKATIGNQSKTIKIIK